MTVFLNSLKDIAENYDHLIIDIFGVLHNGLVAFPDTVNTLQSLKEQGIQTCLLSNTPRRADAAIAQLDDLGIPRNLFDHIVTSGEATYQDFAANREEYGNKGWFIGTDSVQEIIEDFGVTALHSPEGASFILNSIPGTENSNPQQFMDNLKIAANMNLPMICANPDLVVNIGDALYECAGTFAKIYEEHGGHVTYHGKPHAPVYERCHDLLGNPDKSKILAIGDAFHTDITGANNFGIDSVLNLVGIHWEEVRVGGEYSPAKMAELIERHNAKPNFILHGFRY